MRSLHVFPRAILGLAALAWAGLALPAQDAPAPAPPPSQPITLEEAVRLALQGNLDLAVEIYNRDYAREEVVIARADFQPVFEVTASQSVDQQAAAASDLDGADRPRREALATAATVSQRIDTGATVALSSNLNRAESNSDFARPLTYDADLALRVRQPLLSGAGFAANRAARERARIGVEGSDLGYLARAMDVVTNTEIAFFDLAFALRDLEVQRRGLEAAERFLAENEARQRAGLATELDIMQARVGVANRRSQILTAEQAMHDAGDRLLVLLGRHEFSGVPEPAGLTFAPPEPLSTERSYGRALEMDPDILIARTLIRQAELDVTVTRSARLPQLDLGGGVGFSGRDDEAIGDAIDGVPRADGYSWQVDLTLTVPWGLTGNRARFRQSQLSLEQQRARLRQLEQDLLVRVRAIVRAVETDVRAVETDTISADLSARELELEQARFKAGLSTGRLVVEAQQRADEARIRQTLAQIQLKQDLSRLRRIEGRSLETYGVDVLAE